MTHSPHRPLNVPLATEPFDAFMAGTKTVEIRALRRGWTPRHVYKGRRVRLVKGYNPKNGKLEGTVGRVALAERISDLPDWAKQGAGPITGKYYDPYAAVLAFEVLDTGCLGGHPSRAESLACDRPIRRHELE